MNDKNTDFQAMKQGYPNCRVAEVTGLPFRSASLFSGIGGFDLPADWMGWETVFHCEWNEFGRRILNYYWPNAKSYGDITKTDFTIHRGNINILTGGFPCQPYSHAGKRLGKEDKRHLWPEMLRAIREIQPPWVVGENVRGLTTWNGGLVFNEVQADLETEGYEVLPFLLPASGVNAPHERYRIWFVAYAASKRRENRLEIGGCKDQKEVKAGMELRTERSCGDEIITNSNGPGLQAGQMDGSEIQGSNRERRDSSINNSEIKKRIDVTNTESLRMEGNRAFRKQEPPISTESILSGRNSAGSFWTNWPTQPPLCVRNDGFPSGLVRITVPGRRRRRTLTPKQAASRLRNESIKAYGNAIVPQVVYQIYQAIASYEAQYGCR